MPAVTSRLSPIDREQALANYYSAERRSGTPPLEANERMHFFAKRLDAAFERDLEIIRQCMERTK
jgi:hypothetical protein